MDTSLKNAAILANLSALRMTLAGALERAEDAENAIKLGEVNQAIGAALGIDTMLQDAAALYGGGFGPAPERQAMSINPAAPAPPALAGGDRVFSSPSQKG